MFRVTALFILVGLQSTALFSQSQAPQGRVSQNLEQSDSIVRVRKDKGRYDLGDSMRMLRDEKGTLQFEAVRTRERGWYKSPSKVPNLVFDRSTYWFRFRIRNTDATPRTMLLELAYPLHDYVNAYIQDKTGAYRITRTGDRRSIKTRAIHHRHFLFPVFLPAKNTTTVYLRVASYDGLQEPMPLVLWDRTEFARHDSLETMGISMLLGGIMMIALYNFIIFLSLRDISYLHYVLSLVSLTVFQVAYHGFGPIMFWPDHPFWNNELHPNIINLVSIMSILFARSFLKTSETTPNGEIIIRIYLGMLVIAQCAFPFLGMRYGIMLTAICVPLTSTIVAGVSIAALRNGVRAARYFLIAFGGTLLGGILLLLKGIGLLPSTFVTENAVLIAGVAGAALLSLGLTDRINEFRAEKEQARKDALEFEKKTSAELAEKNEQLERLDRLKDDFLANTSHELRTPLNGIIGITESLLAGASGDLLESTRGDLRLVASGGRRLASLVNDILDFSQLRHGDITLQRRALDPSAVIEMVVALSRHLTQGRELELIYTPGETPDIYADENRLEQILHNLVGNALKFTRKGTVTLSTRVQRVSPQGPDGVLEFTVADTGIGIPPEKQELIFESFTQGDGSIAREYSGTGLGLSITRKLVELHGGRIRVESKAAEGSRFIFTIPLSAANEQKEETSPEQDSMEQRLVSAVLSDGDITAAGAPDASANSEHEIASAPTSHSGSGLGALPGRAIRTLIVDDDPVNLKVLRNNLTLLGHHVTQAAGGREALSILGEGETFDLLLLDVMMPGLSGYEVCRILREEKSESELPVIMLTARNRVVDLVAGLESGANDYLVKPFDPRELSARVETMLKLKDAARSQSELAGLNAGLELARELQQSLLPRTLPQVPGLDIAVQYRSMENVGGDYYDLLAQDGGVGALMADVSGHGVPAALIVSIVKITFWFHRRDIHDPDKIFEGMNNALLGNIGNEFVTACYVCVDPEQKILRTSNAGHPPLLVWKKQRGELHQLRPRGRILGFLPNPEFEVQEEQLESGDRIILYTDGVLEAGNEENKLFEEERFHDFIKENEGLDAEGFARELVDTVANWSGGAANVEDDIAVLVIDVK